MRDETIHIDSETIGYFAEPDIPAHAWVMAIHGSNRSAFDYRDTAFYQYQRDLALANHCAFISVSLGQEVWGKESALCKIEKCYQYMAARHYASKCVLMATSAGGIEMFRFSQKYPERVAGMIGIFPVWDMEQITLPSMEKEWGLSGNALISAVGKINPARHPERIPEVPIVICHGLEDTAVPIELHTLALARKVPLSIHITRDKHSTEAYDLYKTPLIKNLLSDSCQTMENDFSNH